MNTNIQRAGVLFIIILLLSSIESYSKEESVEIDTNMVSDKTSTLAGDSAISDSSSEPEKGSNSSFLKPVKPVILQTSPT